jgi:hypothetical protein
MTELQMGLIGLGVAAVIGVFAYNKWQEHRHRKVAEQVLQAGPDDVLLDDARAPEMTKAPTMGSAPLASERNEPQLRVDQVPMAETRVEPSFSPEGLSHPEAAPDDLIPTLEPAFVAEPPPFVQSAAPASPLPAAPSSNVPPAPSPLPPASRPSQAMPLRNDAAVDLPESAQCPLPPEFLDPRLEFIVAMELVEPVSVQQILRSQREALQRVGKPIHWFGFNERNREWERLAADSSLELRSLRVGLQMVNRLGPVSDVDVAVFVGAMQALADELLAVADMPSTRIRDQASALDRFCADVDLEIGVNLISRGAPFSGTKIRALAEAAGMVLGVDGLFKRYDDAGRAQFCLQNYESSQFAPDSIRTLTTHGLTFLLDVPRVDHGERVFMQMTELAKRFAETLQGTLVDDNRQPLSDAQLEHIRREFVGKPQAAMQAYDLPAGSPQAIRLFS